MMKHKWVKTKDGKLKNWWFGYCNGPICAECGAQPCEYCDPKCFDEECPGRKGFRFYLVDQGFHGKLLGIRWFNKTLYIGVFFIVIGFDFSGLFPYCDEEAEDD
jgi:hypothetical protein